MVKTIELIDSDKFRCNYIALYQLHSHLARS
jgi:hypothetical protein